MGNIVTSVCYLVTNVTTPSYHARTYTLISGAAIVSSPLRQLTPQLGSLPARIEVACAIACDAAMG